MSRESEPEPNPKPNKPLDENDLLKAGMLPADPEDDAVLVVTPEEPPAPAESSWAIIDLRAIAAGPREVPSILPREDGFCLVYPGRIHSVAGEPTGMKSWFAACAALSEARAGRNVLLVDFEDRATGWADRFQCLGATDDDLGRIRYVNPHEPEDGSLAKHLEAKDVSLAVFDGVTRAFQLHELDTDRDIDTQALYTRLFIPCAAAGAAVLTVDHVTKLKEGRGLYARGSGEKKSAITGTLYLLDVVDKFGEGKIGRSTILVGKDRCGTIQDEAINDVIGTLVCRSEKATRRIEWRIEVPTAPASGDDEEGGSGESADDRLTSAMERVSRFVEERPGCTTRMLEGMGGKKQLIGEACDWLLHHGFIDVETGSRRAKSWRSVKPFRAAPDPAPDQRSGP
jgi:hypothetical protein